uniref:phage integrase central domain-containing protein n=1 Tax=Pseudomonas lini TaxID=163011 RepID=UPI003F583272
MALSDTTVRQARITGNDYSLGDTDGRALKVMARGRRDEARALVAQGINPYEHRKQQRCSFVMRQSTHSQILRVFKKDVLPTLGRWSIYDINRHDLMHLLSGIEQRRALTTAEQCRTWFKQSFRYVLGVFQRDQLLPRYELKP